VDGGVYIPHIDQNQPLQAECEHFIECVESGQRPQSDGYSGLRVVQALEAATASMRNQSRITAIKAPPGDDKKPQVSLNDKQRLDHFVDVVHAHLSTEHTRWTDSGSKTAGARSK